MRLIPDPAPKQLLIIANGNKLWPMVHECVATSYSFPDHLPGEDEDLVVGFLDMVRDYGDISEDLQSVPPRDATGAVSVFLPCGIPRPGCAACLISPQVTG